APAPPRPVRRPRVEPEPVLEQPLFKVAVVLSSRASAYTDVSEALTGLLKDVEVYDLGDRSLSPRDAFAAIHSSNAAAVVAVGLRAAVYARDYAEVPAVFTQVFNDAENRLIGDTVRGVAAIPPLAAQLDAWLKVNPGLKGVGAIVGSGHERLLLEASDAAAGRGLAFQHRVASSDRETLYLFTRMMPNIDGFWLFPDNRVLSAGVLGEIFENASRHGVQIAIFNDSLLSLGASLSTTTDKRDIARTVVDVLRQIQSNGVETVPEYSPLHEVHVRLNDSAEEKLRLASDKSAGGEP
ncbi:MAG: hypothetical protein KDI09_21820, partial [Halioglobus sp.]|nr:hypothetical protein [Halioglobus sp.]